MPRYDFKCQGDKSCGHVEEYNFPMAIISTVENVTCRVCGRDATRVYVMPQLITAPTFLTDDWRPRTETDGYEARKQQALDYEASWKPECQEVIDKENTEREQLVKAYA